MRLLILVVTATLLVGVCPTRVARACAPAPPEGQEVDIAAEDALIVWDAVKKREHFIRRADFKTTATGFGFLVPTPTRPELAAAPDAVFERLWRWAQPRVEKKRKYDVGWTLCGALVLERPRADFEDMPAAVELLELTRVGGLDAAVLAASDAAALGGWLAANGYHFRPELKDWLEHYVREGWIITAFKVARGAATEGDFGSVAVRMSFDTPRPFFPYREPSDQARPGSWRALRVYVAAAERMEGALGDGERWPALLLEARPVADAAGMLEGALGTAPLPEGLWISAFLDRSSPRPGHADLLFSRAAAQEPYELVIFDVTHVFVPVFVDLLSFALLVGYGGVTLWRRRMAKRQR